MRVEKTSTNSLEWKVEIILIFYIKELQLYELKSLFRLIKLKVITIVLLLLLKLLQ